MPRVWPVVHRPLLAQPAPPVARTLGTSALTFEEALRWKEALLSSALIAGTANFGPSTETWCTLFSNKAVGWQNTRMYNQQKKSTYCSWALLHPQEGQWCHMRFQRQATEECVCAVVLTVMKWNGSLREQHCITSCASVICLNAEPFRSNALAKLCLDSILCFQEWHSFHECAFHFTLWGKVCLNTLLIVCLPSHSSVLFFTVSRVICRCGKIVVVGASWHSLHSNYMHFVSERTTYQNYRRTKPR